VMPSALVSCSNVTDAQVYFIAGYLFCVLYIQFTVLPLIEWILEVLVSIG
jgi:hypothetical protein